MNIRFDAFLQGRERADNEFWGDIRRQQDYLKDTMEINRLLDSESTRNDQRQAATYLTPLLSYWQQAADAGSLDHEWLINQRQAIMNDPNFQRFSPEVQQAVWSKLGETGMQFANRLRADGNLEAARTLLNTFGISTEAAPSPLGSLQTGGWLREGSGYQLSEDGRSLVDTQSGVSVPVNMAAAAVTGRDPRVAQAGLQDLFARQGQVNQERAAHEAMLLSSGQYIRNPEGQVVFNPAALPGAQGAAGVNPNASLFQSLGLTPPGGTPAAPTGATPVPTTQTPAGEVPVMIQASDIQLTPENATALSEAVATVFGSTLEEAQAALTQAQGNYQAQQAIADRLNDARWQSISKQMFDTPAHRAIASGIADLPPAIAQMRQEINDTLNAILPQAQPVRDAGGRLAGGIGGLLSEFGQLGANTATGGQVAGQFMPSLDTATSLAKQFQEGVTPGGELLRFGRAWYDTTPQRQELESFAPVLTQAQQEQLAAQTAFDQLRQVQSQPLPAQVQQLLPIVVNQTATPEAAKAVATNSPQVAQSYLNMLRMTAEQVQLQPEVQLQVLTSIQNLQGALNNGN